MKPCRELSRLPKSIGRPVSLNRRGTTPTTLLPGSTPHPKRALDPTHPSATLPIRAFPYYPCPAFSMQAVHKAALVKDDWQPPPVSTKRHKRGNQLDISLIFKTFKKNTHKRTTLRRRLSRKLSAAISLVFTKGADVAKAPFREDRKVSSPSHPPSLTFDTTTSLPHVLADWTYVITPKLEVYRLPYTSLIAYIRKAFTQVYSQAKKLEETWKDKLAVDQPTRPIEDNIASSDVPPKYSSSLAATPHVRNLDLSMSERIQPSERDKETRTAENPSTLEQVHTSEGLAERDKLTMHGNRMKWDQNLSTTRSEDNNVASLRRDVPRLVFPSQPLANVSDESENRLTLLDEFTCKEEITTSSEMWLGDTVTARLGLPDRFADLSWRELDNALRVASQREASRAEGERRSPPASREALTTPKSDGKLSDDGAVTSSVMSRIFTSKPVFLSESLLKKNGNGKPK
ncbi:hypothetical protein EDD16DRAFT_23488 [Pisolithus croceorrhizus]|nr:hypothetical protein EDD16DRAFT_23488 [Pisolithus croceorrhizus]KAI6132882.1 hypothetical protein EV401DRAFT_1914734 [Pisolithus croceorrhizus]